jgi:light-regulated signal transduction histidine kinase (bacteriophytochrome)
MGTTFSDHLRDFFRQMQSGQLRRTYVEEFQRDAEEGLQVMQTALHRAAHLIQSFKQVAVDQASEERRVFSLQQTVQGILQTLHHMTKRRAIEIQVIIPENIFLDSYPIYLVR